MRLSSALTAIFVFLFGCRSVSPVMPDNKTPTPDRSTPSVKPDQQPSAPARSRNSFAIASAGFVT